MAGSLARAYRFAAAGHWSAGALRGFSGGGDGLVAMAPVAARRIAGSEAGIVAAAGRCGRPIWLRPRTGEIFELHEFGPEPQGRVGVRGGETLHRGPSLLWIGRGDRLHRYAARTLQELGEVHVPGLVASASDGCDGLWLAVSEGGRASLRWLAPDGRLRGRSIRLSGTAEPAAVAADPERRRLALLDRAAKAKDGDPDWRLRIVDLRTCRVRSTFGFTLADGEAPPTSIVADGQGGFRVASDKVPALVIGLSDEGVETSRQALVLPASTALEGLLWCGGLILDCDDGLYRVGPADEDEEGAEPAPAVFITPTLASPPGTPRGWNRADIEVDLPKGASLTASIFASSSEALAIRVKQAIAETERTPSARVETLQKLLDGDNARLIRRQSYKGDGKQVLHLLLDGIADPYLWLRLEISGRSGAEGRLKALTVRYPDRSWLDDLPAIYRDDPGPAAQLRQFLAPFEALYGGLDETIGRLPARIDPETAPAEWLGWLLGWLGFPPTEGLTPDVQRRLLREAGALLEARGTAWALRRMLEIVTDMPAKVDDGGAAGLWVIATGLGRSSPRLGRDTRIISGLSSGFRPGNGMQLGEARLPTSCIDVDRILRAGCARVAIRIAVARDRRRVVLPIVESLLAAFVPAHCAIDLQVVPAGHTRPGGRLDEGWHLADAERLWQGEGERLFDPDTIELGNETHAGAWQLPIPDPTPFAINGNTALDGARRLA